MINVSCEFGSKMQYSKPTGMTKLKVAKSLTVFSVFITQAFSFTKFQGGSSVALNVSQGS